MFQSGETSHGLLDVNEVINEVLGLTNGELKRREIIVHTQLEEKLAPVKASRVQLQQVLFNLITNAIVAMEPVTDRNRLMKIKSELRSSVEVQVTVEDSGKGVDPQNIWTEFLVHSSLPSRRVWGWACRSAVRSSSHMAGACGLHTAALMEPSFSSLFPRPWLGQPSNPRKMG
jgi:light-regulated signal transduction histidine kinase (bacteriophytochrome)